MERSRLFASNFLSTSLVCLALALAYFSYAVLETLKKAPTIIVQIEDAANPVIGEINTLNNAIPSIVEEIGIISKQIPSILSEVEALRGHIPAILSEVEKTRDTIPVVLTEVEQVRLAIPPILEESHEVRQQIPALVKESEGYRELIPEVLAEVEATRALVPETMEQAQQLVAEASVAGQKASEGAVTGFLTGIIKAPLNVVTGASGAVFGSHVDLSKEDIDLVISSAREVITQGDIGKTHSWKNKKTGLKGTSTLIKEFKRNGQLCRTVRLTANKKRKSIGDTQKTACLDQDGAWQLQAE